MNRNCQLVPPPTAPIGAPDRQAIERLRAAFPGWCIGWSHRLVPWSAKRRRDADWTGGVFMLEARTPEMLGELLAECAVIDAKHAGARS